jgi:hypothetical protein
MLMAENTVADLIDQQQIEHQNSMLHRAAVEAAIERARSDPDATLYRMQQAEREELAKVRDAKIAKIAGGASDEEAKEHVDAKFGVLGEVPSPEAHKLAIEDAKKHVDVAKKQTGKSSKSESKSSSSAKSAKTGTAAAKSGGVHADVKTATPKLSEGDK